MQFLNPLILWGALAVGIPIALHFWHQKKGQLLNWAAIQWLTEKDLQQSKGIRLDNILLLTIRCLFLILLVFLLAEPVLNWFKGPDSYQKIHVVQANSLVVNNYRFELEEALKKGEKMYWIEENAEPLDDVLKMPLSPLLSPLILQTCINKIAEINQESGKAQYELYLVNNQALNQVSNVFVPNKFNVHSVIDSTQKPVKSYLELSDKKKLFVNATNRLTVALTLPPKEKFENRPVHNGAINVLLEIADKGEEQSVKAALKALTEIYQIEFLIDEKLNTHKNYDWVFTDDKISFNKKDIPEKTKILFLKKAGLENRLFNGQLPEYLGELLVKQFELNPKQAPLSQQQLQSLFKTPTGDLQNRTDTNEEALFSKSILLFLVIIIGLERWLAIQKNA